MYGYAGRILYLDVASGVCRIEQYDEEFAKLYLGGNGFAAKILYDLLPAGIGPFDPTNAVVFGVGPATDTALPSNSRCCVFSKSPITGRFFDATFGGRFAITQKRTGFEAIVLTGKATRPVYVAVTGEGASLKEAGHLWGMRADVAGDHILQAEGAGTDVATIGPAGENLVRFASIGHFWRGREGVAARGGLGAVLGSKNIKGICVAGTRRTQLANPDELRRIVRGLREPIATNLAAISKFGTPVLVPGINALGGLGTRNLQQEQWDGASIVNGENMSEKLYEKSVSCFGCPVACGKMARVKEGDYAGTYWKVAEYESIYALGPMLDNADVGSLVKANELCDTLGLDAISMGVTLAFACECFEKGLLTERETGMPLTFGDHRTLLRLIEMTARREGFGNLLAEGSARMADQLGGDAHKYLACVKKLEMAGHSARALKGMSIGYATATRGGSHQDGRPVRQYRPDFDHTSTQGQPEEAVRTQHLSAVGDSLTQCRFVTERGMGIHLNETFAEVINAITGWGLTLEDVERIGERIFNLERMFNVREGERRRQDVLPYRSMHEPIPAGPTKGMHCPPEELDRMLDEYYELRGWSREGIPTARKLRELGLEFTLSAARSAGATP